MEEPMVEEVSARAEETAERVKQHARAVFQRMKPTDTRVAASTSDEVNREIGRRLEANIFYYARHPEEIEERLRELDEEWDIERTLETTWSAISLGGFFLGMMARRYSIIGAAAAGFMMQHAAQGWCPPSPLFRRMGVRTSREINIERYALKALRGDFKNIDMNANPGQKAEQAIMAAALDSQMQ
jgi:hypothetical protein